MDTLPDIPAAIARYESYVKAHAPNPLLRLNLGELYHRVSRHEEAIACFERCLQDHPQYASARSHVASVMISQHRFAEAEQLLEDLVSASDQDPTLHYNLGLSRYYQRRWPEAESCFVRAQQLGITTPDCFPHLAACRHFEQILAREPDNARAWLGVGLARLYQQRHDESIKALQQALERIPDSVGIAVTLGWAYLAGRDMKGAEVAFRRSLDIDHNFAEAHGGLASALALQSRVDEAQSAIRRAERLDSQGFGAAFAQTGLLKIQGRHDAATDLLARVLQHSPRPDSKSLLEHLELFARKHPPTSDSVVQRAAAPPRRKQ